jgi:transposase-like protein
MDFGIARYRVVIPWPCFSRGQHGRRSTRPFQARQRAVDIRVGVERRRRWGHEDKLRIVRESLTPNAVVSGLARRYEISTSLLYTWRKQALAGLLEGFNPVRIVPETGAALLPAVETQKTRAAQPKPDVVPLA